MAKCIAASRGWGGVTFDVTTAFLSGKSTSRQIYIRTPHEGLPALPEHGWPALTAPRLLQILKSAYGLTESPRLWYLEALERLSKTPLKELAMCKCVFAAAAAGKTWALLVLHVDDGLLLGNLKDPRFQELRKQIDGMFKIKEWKEVTEKPQPFLGVSITRDTEGNFYDDVSQYIREIKVPELSGQGPLDEKGISLYRQLTQRLRWPAQQTLPQLLYEVSSLAQRVNRATHEDFKEAVELYHKFKTEAEEGRAVLKYPRLDPSENYFYVSYFDASLGKEADGKSQLGAIHFVTTEKARQRPTLAAVVEYATNKSSRVVRSSMAAESASLSLCVDRHLYGRLVFDMLLTGIRDLKDDWRTTMSVPGGIVTDARSLYDHMGSSGQIPTERQTMLDILVAKDHLESRAYELFWVPTHKQYADGLTKKMKNALWEAYCKQPMISLRETESERKLEEHRARLRRDQRQRRKERSKAPKAAA